MDSVAVASHTTAAPIPSLNTAAEVLLTLYEKRILDKPAVAKSIVKLRLKLDDVARTFGYDNPSDFLVEFVQDAAEKSEPAPTWEPWPFDLMLEVTTRHFQDGQDRSDIAKAVGKTYKAVAGFLRRTYDQGVNVDKHVWELLDEGYTAQEIADAGYNSWRARFTQDIHTLRRYCLVNRLPEPVIHFKE